MSELAPDWHGANKYWAIGGTLTTFIWDNPEGGQVNLRTGDVAMVDVGDYVTYLLTGAGISFVSVISPAELAAARSVVESGNKQKPNEEGTT